MNEVFALEEFENTIDRHRRDIFTILIMIVVHKLIS